jgi:hypothetical protein
MRAFLLCVWLLWLYGCKKQEDDMAGFIRYTIKAGEHYTALNTYTPVETTELRFEARFDSTAIYQSQVAENQYDINKLYGFSDNGGEHHHQYSARFGWRWSDGALRLFAYVYNAGKVVSEELGAVPIGDVIRCRIAVAGLLRFHEKVPLQLAKGICCTRTSAAMKRHRTR